jgi:hypothetical protein
VSDNRLPAMPERWVVLDPDCPRCCEITDFRTRRAKVRIDRRDEVRVNTVQHLEMHAAAFAEQVCLQE